MEEKGGRREWQVKCFDEHVFQKGVEKCLNDEIR